jgi:hypothetical protein
MGIRYADSARTSNPAIIQNRDFGIENILMLIFSRIGFLQIVKKLTYILSLLVLACAAAFGQDAKLKILEQPLPELPRNHGTLDVQGTAIYRVQFLEFGEVGEITTVKDLPAGLGQQAMNAIRKIKFTPEVKDGKPVTVIKQLEYTYSWNGGWRLPSTNVERPSAPGDTAKAEAIIAKAVQVLGGDRYLNVRNQVARGKFSILREGMVASFQSFTDVIIFPDKERTDFKGQGSRSVQVNIGDSGWLYDGDQELIKTQTPKQIADFKRGIRTSLDNLLRSGWKGQAELTYAGRRPSTLGRRNDVVKLTYSDGFVVEFEFADDGTPQKAIYQAIDADGDTSTEEDRYAQFIEVSGGGVKLPFIVDRFTDGKAVSRINFESVEVNKSVPESIFARPSNPKDAKKEIKL